MYIVSSEDFANQPAFYPELAKDRQAVRFF
jgi:hypothetical protein